MAVLLRTIRQLKAEGVAVIFVSHKLDELYAVCDRVTIMRDGRTVAVSATWPTCPSCSWWPACSGRDLAEVKKKGATAFEGGAGNIGGELLSAPEHLQSATGCRMSRSTSARGEIVGLAGLLGSGRTETARAIFAADRKTGGSDHVQWRKRRLQGTRPRPSPPAWAIARRTARARASCPACRLPRT